MSKSLSTRRITLALLMAFALPVNFARGAGTDDSLTVRMKRIEQNLSLRAEKLDPAYASINTQLGDVKRDLQNLGDSLGLSDRELTSPNDIDPMFLELQRQANELQDQLVQTKGYQTQLAQQARRFRNIEAAMPARANVTYTIRIVRDPSVPSSITNSTLINYADIAMGWIKAASRSVGGAYFSHTIQFYANWNLTGCDNVTIPGHGYSNIYYLYFRYNETKMNGWAACGDYALVDLSPSYWCAGFWYPNWNDLVATTHELGHVFGASHASCSFYDPWKYNDNECGTSNNTQCSSSGDTCSKETCDNTAYCGQEYYDAYYNNTRVICANDGRQIKDYVNKHQ